MTDTILEVKNLKKYFKTSRGMLHAVDNVSFSIERGKTLGVVGESGCGKSTTGRSILRLIEPTSGEVYFEGNNILKMKSREMQKMRREMQIIFQDPFSSLDPRKSIAQIIGEPIDIYRLTSNKKEKEEMIVNLMETVGLAPRLYSTYPHELDGGRRQRIGIARALAVNPKFIVCDEPVSALDVSIQAQILNLMDELQKERNLTYMFITHDLSVVRYISDDIAVMYLGSLVEKAPAEELFMHPYHPYTRALLSAVPSIDIDAPTERIVLPGEVVSPVNLPNECRFAKRCSKACDQCCSHIPELVELTPGHYVACDFPER